MIGARRGLERRLCGANLVVAAWRNGCLSGAARISLCSFRYHANVYTYISNGGGKNHVIHTSRRSSKFEADEDYPHDLHQAI